MARSAGSRGIHATYQSSRWLSGDWRMMPIVHSVALANKHIHSPYMGPAIMPSLSARPQPTSNEERERSFFEAVRDLQPVTAERHLVALLETHSPAQILELVLELAIRRNGFDDHYFLYVVHAVRALDCIGHEWAEVVLRPAVRYLANKMQTIGTGEDEGNPRFEVKLALYHCFSKLEELIEEFGIVPEALPIDSDDSESDAITELGERIGKSTQFTPVSEMLARALSDGLSLRGAAEALSYGGALASPAYRLRQSLRCALTHRHECTSVCAQPRGSERPKQGTRLTELAARPGDSTHRGSHRLACSERDRCSLKLVRRDAAARRVDR